MDNKSKEDILNACHQESTKHIASISTKYFPIAHADAAYAAMDQYAAQVLENQDPWISVKDRLPENRQVVLAATNTRAGIVQSTFVVLYSNEIVTHKHVFIGFDKGFYTSPCVSHWTPIPKPPKATE